MLRKKGDWNRLQIAAKGPHITVMLNGKKICDVTDNPTDPAEARWKEAGPISLQWPPSGESGGFEGTSNTATSASNPSHHRPDPCNESASGRCTTLVWRQQFPHHAYRVIRECARRRASSNKWTLIIVLVAACTSAAAAQHYEHALPADFNQPIGSSKSGLGTFTRAISSTNRGAQAYFSQGFQLMYAFAKAEAGRSFREAQRQDPNCAICYWGEAWAWVPT